MPGVSRLYVPNVGITRTIGKSLVIRLLGHRSTGHTTPTGPMIRLSPAGNPLRRQVVWGGCDEQQRSISSVLDPGDVLRRILAGGGRDGGRRGAEGGPAVLPLGRGARRGGAGGESSHPLRRRRHLLPAA